MKKLIGRHIFLGFFVFGILINFFSHPAHADPVQWFHNGHWYDLVNAPMINWYEADTDSKNLQLEGKKGHLVTITSEAENQFLIDTFGVELKDRWIGSYQVDGSMEPNGGWRWVTGEPWDYTNWDTFFVNH